MITSGDHEPDNTVIGRHHYRWTDAFLEVARSQLMKTAQDLLVMVIKRGSRDGLLMAGDDENRSFRDMSSS